MGAEGMGAKRIEAIKTRVVMQSHGHVLRGAATAWRAGIRRKTNASGTPRAFALGAAPNAVEVVGSHSRATRPGLVVRTTSRIARELRVSGFGALLRFGDQGSGTASREPARCCSDFVDAQNSTLLIDSSTPVTDMMQSRGRPHADGPLAVTGKRGRPGPGAAKRIRAGSALTVRATTARQMAPPNLAIENEWRSRDGPTR